MKTIIVWDVKPYSQIEIHSRLGGNYCFCLQGRRVRTSRQPERSECLLVAYLDSFTQKMEGTCSSETSPNYRYYMAPSPWRFYYWGSLRWESRTSQAKGHWKNAYSWRIDRLCGLVVRVSDYRSRSDGLDSLPDQIFWEVGGLERGSLSLVRSNEELLERKSSGSDLENRY
jgi:hypothetical protein